MKNTHFILILLIGFAFAQNIEDKVDIPKCSAITIDIGSFLTIGQLLKWDCRTSQELPSIHQPSNLIQQLGGICSTNSETMKELISSVIANLINHSSDQQIVLIIEINEDKEETCNKLNEDYFEQVIVNIIQNQSLPLKYKSSFLPQSTNFKTKEIIYDWIAVNYALRNFSFSLNDKFYYQTSGIVSFHKYKMSICYQSQDQSQFGMKAEDIKMPNDKTYQLSYQTFSDFGIETMFQKLISRMKESNTTFGYCFSPIQNDENYDLKLPSGFKFKGRFFPNNCINSILEIIGIDNCFYSITDIEFKENQCESYLPKIKGDFVASGLVYYVKEMFFSEKNQRDEINTKEFRKKAIEYCNKEIYSSQFEANKSIISECFLGMYTSTLLIDGFGMVDNEILIPRNINNFRVDWTVGKLMLSLAKYSNDYEN